MSDQNTRASSVPLKNDDNKENKSNSKRQQRTKQEQFDLLINFFQTNNEALMESETFNRNWERLVVSLNNIGPPNHTVVEWRKVWSDYKYNKKRKRSDSDFQGSDQPTKKPPSTDEPKSLAHSLAIHQPLFDMKSEANKTHTPPNTFEKISPLRDLDSYVLLSTGDDVPLSEGNTFSDNRLNESHIAEVANIPINTQSTDNSNAIPDGIDSDSLNAATIINKLSEIAVKLDILIGHQIETNKLLKYLAKEK